MIGIQIIGEITDLYWAGKGAWKREWQLKSNCLDCVRHRPWTCTFKLLNLIGFVKYIFGVDKFT